MKTLFTLIFISISLISFCQKPFDKTTPLPKDNFGKVSFVDSIIIDNSVFERFQEHILTNHSNQKEVGEKTLSEGNIIVYSQTLGISQQYGNLLYNLISTYKNNKLYIKITNFKHKGRMINTGVGQTLTEDFNLEVIYENKFNKKFTNQLIGYVNEEVINLYKLLNK